MPYPAPSPVADEPAEQRPLLFDRYRLLERRATGGFGEVDVSWDTRLQRRVAIKKMPLRAPESPATPLSTVDEALAEARTSCLLSHPNIVTMFDFESDGQNAYLVMEYVDGLSLAELLQRVEGGVLVYDECAYVLSALGSALEYAHENGVLHLDIKPANVFIDRSGAVKLGDFGMATLASAAGYGGARGGTVGYMAPEQLLGETVDERSDVFSLAVIAYQMLTGRNPFAAASAEESLALVEKGARPLSKFEEELAGPVETAVAQALEPNPSFRTTDVASLVGGVVPSLGSAAEGKESLASIMRQVDDDDGEVAAPRQEPRPLLSERAPWLAGALERALAAMVCGWLAFRLAPGLRLETTLPAGLIVGGVACVGAAAVPALGSALVLVELVAVIALGGSGAQAAPLLLAGGVAVAGAMWWGLAGRRGLLGASALLLPSAVLQPVAGSALSSLAFGPAGAFATASAGWLLVSVMRVAVSSGFSSVAVASDLAAQAVVPALWIGAAGSGLAAAVASALAHRGSVPLAELGMLLGALVVTFSQLVSRRMENGGIWSAPDWDTVAVAVVCFVLMGVFVAAFGTPQTHTEGETQ
jgi:serine/threonine-protein kinase